MTEPATARTRLRLLESVRCLGCSAVYAKPAEGGTASENPGCPACGYVGWLPVTLPSAPRRSGGDPRPRRSARSR